MLRGTAHPGAVAPCEGSIIVADEHATTPAGMPPMPASPAAPPRGRRPGTWKLLGLGAVVAFTWLAAIAVDLLSVAQQPPVLSLSLWQRSVVRAVLVLVPPVLVLFLDRSVRAWMRQRGVVAFAFVLPALLVAALPALYPLQGPVQGPQSGLMLLLLVPTASLGVALGVVNSAGGRRRLTAVGDAYSGGGIAGLGFSLAIAFVAVVLFVVGSTTASCVTSHGLGCGAISSAIDMAVCASVFVVGLAGTFAAAVGFEAGAWVVKQMDWMAAKAGRQ